MVKWSENNEYYDKDYDVIKGKSHKGEMRVRYLRDFYYVMEREIDE